MKLLPMFGEKNREESDPVLLMRALLLKSRIKVFRGEEGIRNGQQHSHWEISLQIFLCLRDGR